MPHLKPLPADDVPPRIKKSAYPEPFASLMDGRSKKPLGDVFGLKNFGVNLTTLSPGGISALHHVHSVQDEFIYVVSGHPTVFIDEEKHNLEPGMVIGFPANGPAHHLANETQDDVVILEVGDRLPGDAGAYPHDDLVARFEAGAWRFTRKDGSNY